MYKVLLVDDEEKVIQGMVRYIQWEDHGFQVAATAMSMDEAIKKYENESVDLVVTDIRMPGGSGLDLMSRLKTYDEDLAIGILSAYGEFEYAQTAIKNGALAYLLKPVDFTEFHHFLDETKKSLDTRQAKAGSYIQFVKEKQLLLMLRNQSEGPNTYLMDDYPWLYEICHKQLIRFQYVGEKDQDMIFPFQDILDQFYSKEDYIMFDKSHKERLIVIHGHLLRAFEDSLAKEASTEDWVIGISSRLKTSYQLGVLYDEASKAVFSHSLTKDKLVFYDEIKGHLLRSQSLREEMALSLKRDLSISSYTKFMDRIRKESKKRIDENGANELMIRFFVQVFELVQQEMIEHRDYKKIQQILYQLTGSIVMCQTKEDILDQVEDGLKEIFKLCSEVRKTKDIIDMAKAYIDQHYSDDICLETVAEHVFIHPIYLSRLFKEKTGDNFSSYITKVRLEKAKALLMDQTLKTYEISEMIGYESSKYFSRVFKQNIGCTPRDWRRMERKDTNL